MGKSTDRLYDDLATTDVTSAGDEWPQGTLGDVLLDRLEGDTDGWNDEDGGHGDRDRNFASAINVWSGDATDLRRSTIDAPWHDDMP